MIIDFFEKCLQKKNQLFGDEYIGRKVSRII